MTELGSPNGEETLLRRLFALYPSDARYVLAVLEDIQAQLGYIPQAMLAPVAAHFSCPEDVVQGWRNRGDLFRPHARARHRLEVCLGPCCRSCGGQELWEDVCAAGAPADVDIEISHCLACCTKAPVARLDGIRLCSADAVSVQAALDRINDADGD